MSEQWKAEQPGPETVWSDDDELYGIDERTDSYPPDGLVTLRFLKDAVRRHARLWIAVAILGLALGTAVPFVMPPASQSSAKLLLTHREGDNLETAMATDASLVTTRAVAQVAIQKLGLADTPDQLLKRYSATALTGRVLEIDAKAPTSAEATALADTIASAYLVFRNQQIAEQAAPLQADLAAAATAVKRAEAAVRAAGGDPSDASAPTTTLTARLGQARENQRYIEQQLLDQQVSAARMTSSRVLDQASPVRVSRRHTQIVATGSGLMVGLFLGIGFIVVRAMISDRLWRRQDVAQALGVPIRLSIGRPRLRRRPTIRRLRAPEPDLGPVVRHLGWTVTGEDGLAPALAVVSIDTTKDCARLVALLARSFAEHGQRVLVADLTDTGDLAARFGIKKPGTFEAPVTDADLPVNVHRPASGTGALEGLRLHEEADGDTDEEKALRAVWAAADVVLVHATLSPALGADYLRAWASRAALVATAGRSNATTLHATGEMIRLAGLHVETAVLLRADRTDDSLGQWETETEHAEQTKSTEHAKQTGQNGQNGQNEERTQVGAAGQAAAGSGFGVVAP
ncbi:subunit length determinant protein [Kribbella pratensis]|jgi:capsular polysaccharide biosynthesis protein|uniref:Subunit length determinant protein n=1 Tax=Kribbella pratensis TaxID=2512112 RepID=A0ABY2FNB7_9ACTN|nr:Wzz/FepE/Etk N-terminal domain-containing protein [Kribbella pratensis]TDW94259.1 subunit length determinant protein [Kribbella pratensis]